MRLHRCTISGSAVGRWLLMLGQEVVPDLKIENAGMFVGLRYLIGDTKAVEDIVAIVVTLDRDNALLMLSQLSAALGEDLDSTEMWARHTLLQTNDCHDPQEIQVAKAISALLKTEHVIHGLALSALQILFIGRGQSGGRPPSPKQLLLLLLAISDHIPLWQEESIETDDSALAEAAFAHLFNRSEEDVLRLCVRLAEMFGAPLPVQSPIKPEDWQEITLRAFGAPFDDYMRLYLALLCLLSKIWRQDPVKKHPALNLTNFQNTTAGRAFARWFDEASVEIEGARQMCCDVHENGLPMLSAEFFRRPFLRRGDEILCLSPDQLSDHFVFGTWAKLNTAAKEVLKTTSSQRFASTFGYMYEGWCADYAKRVQTELGQPDELLLPSHTGATDEIEDIVYLSQGCVALLSVKASIVPEAAIKTARTRKQVVEWFERFFFEDPGMAKKKRHRGGAIHQLHRKVESIRGGALERVGVSRDSVVLPVIVTFDRLDDSVLTRMWLDEKMKALGLLSACEGVSPVTLANPEGFESLLCIAAKHGGVCEVLRRRTTGANQNVSLKHFLVSLEPTLGASRLPSSLRKFDELGRQSIDRLKEVGFGAE